MRWSVLWLYEHIDDLPHESGFISIFARPVQERRQKMDKLGESAKSLAGSF